jgi:pterin-4a-carbinolamine dehydratase
MANSIFISYRRSDSQHAAFAIADRVRWAFGQDEVFFDRGSIEGGDEWSESIKNALQSAKVVLVVIGASWLRVADAWGRRRLDDPKDWVRREVCEALARQGTALIEVIPVYLDGVTKLSELALDAPLQRLPALQSVSLPNEFWEPALDNLIDLVAAKGNITRANRDGRRNPNGSLAKPEPLQKNRKVMTDEEVRIALAPLSFWQLNWSSHPWGVGHQAQEICKVYEFGSFIDAIQFMSFAATAIDKWKPAHHPRWENQWKVVTASLSTWDVGCRVTDLDIDAAKKLDQLYFKRPQTAG